jgi:hypothetical protein
MTDTAVEDESAEQLLSPAPSSAATDEQLIAMLVDRARNEGLQLTGESGLLQQLTKRGRLGDGQDVTGVRRFQPGAQVRVGSVHFITGHPGREPAFGMQVGQDLPAQLLLGRNATSSGTRAWARRSGSVTHSRGR